MQSRASVLKLGIVAWTLAAGMPAWAGDEFVVRTNYYPVAGSTARELMASSAQNRPWKTNLSFHALTEWSIEWSFRVARTEAAARLTSFETKTRVTVTLPSWKPPAEVDPGLIEQWQQFFNGLATHELGHVRLAGFAAAEMHRRVATLGSFTSVRELQAQVNRAAEQVMDEFRGKERQYDQQTDHGVAQGAVLRGRLGPAAAGHWGPRHSDRSAAP